MKKILFLLPIVLLFNCDINQNESDSSLSKETKEAPAKAESEEEVKIRKMTRVAEGQLMPTGILYDLDSTSFSTDVYKGKLLFLDFWATWCGPCLKGTPIFNSLGEKYKNEKVAFISISVDDEFRFWKEFIQENNWSGNNYWLGMKEEESLFSFTYSKVENIENILISLPQYVFISPEGQIISKIKSNPSSPEFEKKIKELIDKYVETGN